MYSLQFGCIFICFLFMVQSCSENEISAVVIRYYTNVTMTESVYIRDNVSDILRYDATCSSCFYEKFTTNVCLTQNHKHEIEYKSIGDGWSKGSYISVIINDITFVNEKSLESGQHDYSYFTVPDFEHSLLIILIVIISIVCIIMIIISVYRKCKKRRQKVSLVRHPQTKNIVVANYTNVTNPINKDIENNNFSLPVSTPITASVHASVPVTIPVSVPVSISTPIPVSISTPVPVSISTPVPVSVPISTPISIPITIPVSAPISNESVILADSTLINSYEQSNTNTI